MTHHEMAQVFIARHPTEAHHVRGLLENEEISVEVRGEAIFGARGELPIQEASPSVWVPIADARRARDLLKDYGADPVAGGDGGQWLCQKCGENLEPQFSACWSCGTERAT